MHQFLQKLILLNLLLSLSFWTFSQNIIQGQIKDERTEEVLIGVTVAIKGTVNGTITDINGNFTIETAQSFPITLSISSVGYESQEVELNNASVDVNVSLKEQIIKGREVVVSASRVDESLLESPVTIERIDILNIRNTPASNFYESIQNLKGVDMNTQSLTFQAPNTRGFGGNAGFRMLQLIDGVDNQGPGLNFSPGNLLGIPEIDVESVELLPGATSVLYGPGAINGTLLMTSKNPFDYQGLSANVKVGMMHINSPDSPEEPMYNISLRYAKAFNNKIAFKAVFSYLDAVDWHATDYRNRSTVGGVQFGGDESTLETNPAYSGINNYGGQIAAPLPLEINGTDTTFVTVARTGYNEEDLTDYKAQSIKGSLGLHYRFSEKVEGILQMNLGYGSSMYTGATRVQLLDFFYGQFKAEVRGDNFFVRTYTTQERSGDSYDIGFTASSINNTWKSDAQWFGEYALVYTGGLDLLLQGLIDGGIPINPNLQGFQAGSHADARRFADGTASNSISPLLFENLPPEQRLALSPSSGRLQPGTSEFQAALDDVTNKSISDGGAQFFDETNMYHTEVMYNFKNLINPEDLEIIVGGHYRTYDLNSQGTVFDDANRDIIIWETGAYAQITRKLFDEQLKLMFSARYDKSQNFEGRFTPRVAAVYSLGELKQHNFRISYQTAFRNPSVQDQYLNLNVGGVVQVIGGIPELIDRYNLNGNVIAANPQSIQNFINDNTATAQFTALTPEFVNSYEIGYKGVVGDKLFVDGYAYYNQYENFIGNQTYLAGAGAVSGGDANVSLGSIQFDNGSPRVGTFDVFQVPVNSTVPLNSYGWGLGIDYNAFQNYIISGNVSSNILDDLPSDAPEGFRTLFNTPEYRLNIGLSNRNIADSGFGFNVIWRWQDEFVWQSTFGDGLIPAYSTLDAQVSYNLKSIKAIAKLGGTNLLNNRYIQSFGNPTVGALYYLSLSFDGLLN